MEEIDYIETANEGAGNTPESLNISELEGVTPMPAKAVSQPTTTNQDVALPADPYISMIERVAMDPTADIEKLERMLQMKERMEDRAREDAEREARRAFFADLAKAQSEIPIVLRNKNNTQTSSKYADLAAIEDAAMPVIRSHGFSISAWSTPGADQGSQRVRYRVAHRDGHIDEIEDDFPLDMAGIKGTVNKTELHGKQSTVTYARRNFNVSYFNIATADDDGNSGGGKVPNTISAEQFVELRDKAEKAKIAEETICKAFGVPSFQVFLARDFDSAMKRLDRNIAKNEG